MKTLIVNAFGGPCAGKTTCCWEIASRLKKKGIITEYVSEYTKELIYEGKMYMLDDTMKNQRIILAEQKHRLDRLLGKVQVVVTDSPLLLSIVYANDRTEKFTKEILDIYNSYDNLNFVIKRPDETEFEQTGRKQNYEESVQKDKEIIELLQGFNLEYTVYNRRTIKDIVEQIENTIKELED